MSQPAREKEGYASLPSDVEDVRPNLTIEAAYNVSASNDDDVDTSLTVDPLLQISSDERQDDDEGINDDVGGPLHHHRVRQRLTLSELSGACGDFGTLIPLLVAMARNRTIYLAPTLFLSGIVHIITGVYWDIPMPLQPMKAIASLTIAQELTRTQVTAAGVGMGLCFLLLSFKNMINILNRWIPASVIAGLQLGVGWKLALKGIHMIQGLPWWFSSPSGDCIALSIICGIMCLFGSRKRPPSVAATQSSATDVDAAMTTTNDADVSTCQRFLSRPPTGIILFLFGTALAGIKVISDNPDTGNEVVSSEPLLVNALHNTTAMDWRIGILTGTLTQLPLTTLNSCLSVCMLAHNLFPSHTGRPVSRQSVCISIGLINTVLCPLGMMPTCHGAGGLAGQHRLGANTGISMVALGILKIGMGLMASQGWLLHVLDALPISILGILLVLAGHELALTGVVSISKTTNKIPGYVDGARNNEDAISDATRNNEDAIGVCLITALVIVGTGHTHVGALCGWVVSIVHGSEEKTFPKSCHCSVLSFAGTRRTMQRDQSNMTEMAATKGWRMGSVAIVSLILAPVVLLPGAIAASMEAGENPRKATKPHTDIHQYPQPQKIKQRLYNHLHGKLPMLNRGLQPLEDFSLSSNLTQESQFGSNSTVIPSPFSTNPPNQRFIAMVNTKDPCLPIQQYQQYTDIMLSYTTTVLDDGTCSETCEINTSTVPVCNNQPNDDVMQSWYANGKRIWLVFGGPSMGKDYDLVTPACWEFCFGRQQLLVESVSRIINDVSPLLHGVVINYQYMYENDQDDSGFLRGGEAQVFVRQLTTRLREELNDEIRLAHMPVDGSVVIGTEYFSLMSDLAQDGQFDLLFVQYFDGILQPASNPQAVLQHFDTLVTFMFKGDASKIVIGMCNDFGDQLHCGGSQYALDSVDGASMMTSLSNVYPCHGGAFFWSASSDPSGFWSIPLLGEYTPTLNVEECTIIEENLEDEDNSDNNQDDDNERCISTMEVSTCMECVNQGCGWCLVDGESSCGPRQSNGTSCVEVCLPDTATENVTFGPNSLIRHNIRMEGLSQEYFGITYLPTASVELLEDIHANHVKSFFSSKIDQALLLDSNITVIEVILPTVLGRSLRRTKGPSSHRKIQHDGSSVVVVFDQEVSYWYPVVQTMLSPESLSIVPFATESARDELVSILQGSDDPVLGQVLGVSEIILTPQPPSESPIVPPITTFPPTTMRPTTSPTPLPTKPPQIVPPGQPNSPSDGALPTNGPIFTPTSPPVTAPSLENEPTTVAEPTQSQPVATSSPSLNFIVDPPIPVQARPTLPLLTQTPTPDPTRQPTAVPTRDPTALPSSQRPTGAANDNQPSSKSESDYPIFGKYTGFIVIAIVFGGLLLIFTLYMKYCMGEYVND